MWLSSPDVQREARGSLTRWLRRDDRGRDVTVLAHRFAWLTPEELLARTPRSGLERWHFAFLNGGEHAASLYFREHLLPRWGAEQSLAMCRRFAALFESVRERGVRRCAWVADVRRFDAGFDYYRLDGCRRACCAAVLGLPRLPTLVFQIEVS